MTMFFPPIPLIRRNVIIRKLKAHGAVCEKTAVRLEDAGIPFPDHFTAVTKRMLRQGIMRRTQDGRYYITI